jgi:hypothetical protein
MTDKTEYSEHIWVCEPRIGFTGQLNCDVGMWCSLESTQGRNKKYWSDDIMQEMREVLGVARKRIEFLGHVHTNSRHQDHNEVTYLPSIDAILEKTETKHDSE